MPFRTQLLENFPDLAYAHAELSVCHLLHANRTLHSCHDRYGPTATRGTYADMVHNNNNNNGLQGFQLIIFARYLLGVPKPWSCEPTCTNMRH